MNRFSFLHLPPTLKHFVAWRVHHIKNIKPEHMTTVNLGANPVHIEANLPEVGSEAPAFTLTDISMAPVSLADYKGQWVILSIFPSIDTGICAQSTRVFNTAISETENAKVLCISKDLPFAHKRFCGAEGLENVISLADFKNNDFSDGYGIKMVDGGMEGVFARAIVVVNPDGKVAYTELVPQVGQEPDYDRAFAAVGE